MSKEQETAMYDQPEQPEDDATYRVMNTNGGYISDEIFTDEEALAKAAQLNAAFKPLYKTWIAVEVRPYM